MRVGKNHSDSSGRQENKFPLAGKRRQDLMINLVSNIIQYIFKTTYNISYV